MKFMLCKKCGAENDNNDVFCYLCGNKLEIPNIRENTESTEKKCPKCGQMLGKDDAFCFKCGEDIANSSNGKIEIAATENADVQSVENVSVSSSSTTTINPNAKNIIPKVILIFIVIAVVVGALAAFDISDSKRVDDYDSKIKTVQESCFVFLPDVTIGELIHEYYGDNYWIYNVPERCVEYYGDNKKDKSGIDIRFQFVEKNRFTASYVMFNAEGEEAHGISIEEFEEYMTSLYNDYVDDDNMQQGTKSEDATTQLTESATANNPKSTEAAKAIEAPDVNYSLYTAAINKICLQYYGYDLSNCYYTLFDINRDGVQELIINVAEGSMDDKFMFCTIRDNEAVYVGEMYSRYVWLSEKNNELYANLGHSGYQTVQRIDFDGSGISTETISEGEIAGDYTTYGKSLETSALDDSSLLLQFYTDDDFPYVEAYVETYDYSGLDGAESRLYVDGDFAYIEVEKASVDDDTFLTVGTYQESECGDYIDLHFNAYAEPETTIFVTPYNKNGMAGNVKACVVPQNATDTIKTNTITVIPVDQKGQIAIYDGSKVAGFTTSYVVEGGACTLVRESLGDQWHVTAKNKCTNYGVEWYELWDTDDGDYYGWVDSNYISFY